MNKGELIDALADRGNMSRAESGRALDALIEIIRDQLVRGEQIALVGFGTFGVSNRGARVGKNPRTGEAIKIAARRVPKFTPGKGLKDAVSGAAKKGGAKAAGKGAKAPAKGGAKSAKAPAKTAAKGGAKKR